MLCGVCFLVFCSFFLFLLGLGQIIWGDRFLVEERLRGLQEQKESRMIREELQKPLWERLGKPIWKKLVQVIGTKMTAGWSSSLQHRLVAAGFPLGLEPGEFAVIQFFASLLVGGAFLSYGLLAGWDYLRVAVLAGTGLVFGYLFPQVYLNVRISKRQRQVLKDLPDLLDLLTISVQAGLGFDMAMVKVTERFKGVLGEEFKRVLQEIKMGKPRRDALKDMANRIAVEDFSSFVSALTQADQLGVSIADILHLQSQQIRRKRRQRAQEQAMQAPVKMLFPLVFFIFPAIFVVLLGPALIQIMQSF